MPQLARFNSGHWLDQHLISGSSRFCRRCDNCKQRGLHNCVPRIPRCNHCVAEDIDTCTLVFGTEAWWPDLVQSGRHWQGTPSAWRANPDDASRKRRRCLCTRCLRCSRDHEPCSDNDFTCRRCEQLGVMCIRPEDRGLAWPLSTAFIVNDESGDNYHFFRPDEAEAKEGKDTEALFEQFALLPTEIRLLIWRHHFSSTPEPFGYFIHQTGPSSTAYGISTVTKASLLSLNSHQVAEANASICRLDALINMEALSVALEVQPYHQYSEEHRPCLRTWSTLMPVCGSDEPLLKSLEDLPSNARLDDHMRVAPGDLFYLTCRVCAARETLAPFRDKPGWHVGIPRLVLFLLPDSDEDVEKPAFSPFSRFLQDVMCDIHTAFKELRELYIILLAPYDQPPGTGTPSTTFAGDGFVVCRRPPLQRENSAMPSKAKYPFFERWRVDVARQVVPEAPCTVTDGLCKRHPTPGLVNRLEEARGRY
jgi:hypothetical protein